MCGRGRRDAPWRADPGGPWADGYLGRYPVRPGYAYVIWKGRHVAEPGSCRPRRRPGSGRRSARRGPWSTATTGQDELAHLGNGVPHLHVHLVPRPYDDARAGARWSRRLRRSSTPAVDAELGRRPPRYATGWGAEPAHAWVEDRSLLRSQSGAAGRGPHRRGLRVRRGSGAQARPARVERPVRLRGDGARGSGRRGHRGRPPARHRHRGRAQRGRAQPGRRSLALGGAERVQPARGRGAGAGTSPPCSCD